MAFTFFILLLTNADNHVLCPSCICLLTVFNDTVHGLKTDFQSEIKISLQV